MSAAARILVARETAQVTYGKSKERAIIHKGVTRVREGHPILRGNAELFEPLTAHFEVDGSVVDDEPVLEPEGCPDCAARAEADAAAAEDAGDDAPPEEDKSGDEPSPEPTSDDRPADPPADAPVETVTANPGQKRVTRQRTPRAKRG